MMAWLIGLHVSGSTAALRFHSESGERLLLVDSYFPYFYALCSGNHEEVAHIMQQHPKVISAHIEHKLASIRDSVLSPLVKITCSGIQDFDRVCKDMGKVPGVLELAETSLPHYLRYALDKGVRFFHLHEIEFAQGRLVRAECKGEKGIPLFNCAALYNNFVMDSHGAKSYIRSFRDLHGFIQSNQIDCIFSWNAGIPKAMMADLGCIHIRIMDDISHDIYPDEVDLSSVEAIFLLGRKRLLRMIELCMMTGASPEDVLSISPGRLNTYLHIAAARRRGHVIPEFKKEMERPKSLALLRAMDKGGIIFYPEPGIYAQIAKCDFASMYPSIIVNYNISPEMMDCSCGNFHLVPESGWRICKARQGVIPEGIQAVLERRLALKKLMKLEKDPALKEGYNLRQKALKNILVTCMDGNTMIPYVHNDELKLEKIKDIVEPLANGKEGIVPVTDSIKVFGFDTNFNSIENPVRNAIKLPSKRMIRLKLEWQREIKITEDHLCYLLEEGKLITRKAGELKVGQYIPLASRVSFNLSRKKVDIISELVKRLPEDELRVWRVFGDGLKEKIAEKFEEIKSAAISEFTLKSIYNWKDFGYIPLKFFPLIDLPEDHDGFFIGRGKRSGGIIKKIPTTVHLDLDLGFLLGFFAGDGSYGYDPHLMRLDLGMKEKDVADRLARIVRDKFNLSSSLKKEKKANMYVMQINSIALNRIFELVFGLGGSSESGKLNISPFILNSNREFLYGFISGLIASDGYMSKSRNYANISSCSQEFVRKLGFILSLLGLEYRINRSGTRLSEIQLRDLKDLNSINKHGLLKETHKEILEYKNNNIRSYRNPQFPVFESRLFELCRKTRTPPWLGQRERVSKRTALCSIARIDKGKLDHEDLVRLDRLRKLAASDIVFAKIKEIIFEEPSSPFVYCFEVENEMPGFISEGGIFTHNCFGYLGFKNFIFSNVECKECVMLYGRHILTRTKEIAEQMGLEVIYGIVDSVFVKGGTEQEYRKFVNAVSKEIGITLELDCIFRKIAFPCADDGSGVANKYYGIDLDKKIEARGIAIRHSDSPKFIKDFQATGIPLLLSEEGLEAGLKMAESVRSEFEEKILRKKIPLESLAITKSVRKDPDDYLNQAAHVVAFKQMPNASGVSVYIHTTRGPKPLALASLQIVDCEKYIQLLNQSLEELVKGIKKGKEELKLGAYC